MLATVGTLVMVPAKVADTPVMTSKLVYEPWHARALMTYVDAGTLVSVADMTDDATTATVASLVGQFLLDERPVAYIHTAAAGASRTVQELSYYAEDPRLLVLDANAWVPDMSHSNRGRATLYELLTRASCFQDVLGPCAVVIDGFDRVEPFAQMAAHLSPSSNRAGRLAEAWALAARDLREFAEHCPNTYTIAVVADPTARAELEAASTYRITNHYPNASGLTGQHASRSIVANLEAGNRDAGWRPVVSVSLGYTSAP